MSADHESLFEDLLSRYLETGLEASEEQKLLQYASQHEFAERFLEMTKLNAEIAGLLAAPVPDAIMAQLVLSKLQVQGKGLAPFRAATSPEGPLQGLKITAFHAPQVKRVLWPFSAAAAAILIGLAVVITAYFLNTPRAVARVEVALVKGEVYFTDGTGQVRLTGSQSLPGGGRLKTVGPASRVTVTLPDGTRLALGGDSSLTTVLPTGKRQILLEEGMLTAEVSPQRDHGRLIFSTPEAVAMIRGTKFTLIRRSSQTLLFVVEGVVLFARSTGGPEIVVAAGFHAEVERNNPLRALPNSRVPKLLQEELRASR